GGRRRARPEQRPRILARRPRGLATSRPPARREYAHAAAREESLPLTFPQPAPEGEGGGDRVAPRGRALEGPDPRAVLEPGGVGPGIWGVDAASHAYFGVPPSRLTEEQA